MEDLNVGIKTIKLVDENIRSKLLDIDFGYDYFGV